MRPVQRRCALSEDAHEIQRAEQKPSVEGQPESLRIEMAADTPSTWPAGPRRPCEPREAQNPPCCEETHRGKEPEYPRRHGAPTHRRLGKPTPEGRASLVCALSRDAAPYPETPSAVSRRRAPPRGPRRPRGHREPRGPAHPSDSRIRQVLRRRPPRAAPNPEPGGGPARTGASEHDRCPPTVSGITFGPLEETPWALT